MIKYKWLNSKNGRGELWEGILGFLKQEEEEVIVESRVFKRGRHDLIGRVAHCVTQLGRLGQIS